MNTADVTTRMQRKDSASNQRKGSRAVERKLNLKSLPKSEDPNVTPWPAGGVCSGAATTVAVRGMIQGHPAYGSLVGPCETAPTRNWQERGQTQSAAAQQRGIATHWRRLRHRREQAGGSGEQAKTQQEVSKGVACSRTLGVKPLPTIKIQCAKGLARPNRVSSKFHCFCPYFIVSLFIVIWIIVHCYL